MSYSPLSFYYQDIDLSLENKKYMHSLKKNLRLQKSRNHNRLFGRSLKYK
jgi:hypothetical protein